MEAGLVGLLLVSGIAGFTTSSPQVMISVFVGGLVMWLVLTFPSYIRELSTARHNKEEAAAKAAAAAAAASGATPAGKAAQPAAAAAPAPAGGLPPAAQVLELIKKRRAVFPKDYNGEPVARAEVEQLLEAANWAPTHGKTEPWRFVVLEGSGKKAMEDLTVELCRTRLPAEKAEATVAKLEGKREANWGKVSCQIAICCKRRAVPEKLMPEWEEMAAVSCAVQNMWLMATALGLAGYWTSWQEVAREAPEMKELLGLAPEDRVLGFFTLGRSARIDGYRGARGPWQDKVTWKS